jgi:hypothetical protein
MTLLNESSDAATYATPNKHNRQTYKPSAGFKPAIPATKRLQTLDSTASGIGLLSYFIQVPFLHTLHFSNMT